jgi:hypothetical protein
MFMKSARGGEVSVVLLYSCISLNLPKVGEPLLYTYGYDVLNRLVSINTARNLNTTTNNREPVSVSDFGEQIS